MPPRKFDPYIDSGEFLVRMFLQDLNSRCHEEVRKLSDASLTMEELDACMKAHKFSFAAFYRKWLRGLGTKKTGALRKSDRQARARHYIRWRKRHPDRERHPNSEYIRKHMKAKTLSAGRIALSRALKETVGTNRK